MVGDNVRNSSAGTGGIVCVVQCNGERAVIGHKQSLADLWISRSGISLHSDGPRSKSNHSADLETSAVWTEVSDAREQNIIFCL